MAPPRHLLIVLAVISSSAGVAAVGGGVSVSGQIHVPIIAPPSCTTTGNFTSGDAYQVNLIDLMELLPRNAIANGGFSHGTSGQAPDEVFGLLMCYADGNRTQCQNCLQRAAAAAKVEPTCPNSRSYDACVLRYSNVSFFSVADLTILSHATSNLSVVVTDVASMSTARSKLMSDLADEAAVSELRFANGSRKYTDSQGDAQVMYALAQCSRDLNASECTRCLEHFVEALSSTWQPAGSDAAAVAVKGYSCYVAYQIGTELQITMPSATDIAGAGAAAPSPQPSTIAGTAAQPAAAPVAAPPPHAGPTPTTTPTSAGMVAGVAGSVIFVTCTAAVSLGSLWRRLRRWRSKKAGLQESTSTTMYSTTTTTTSFWTTSHF